jgi:nitroreductase
MSVKHQLLLDPDLSSAAMKGAIMFLSLIRNRRSIRQYTNKHIEAEKIDQLLEATLRPPSSNNLKPWEFVLVTDKDLLLQLSGAKPKGASFLKDAALGIVVCADPGKCDVWIEDASIAAAFIHLAAVSLGLGSCWIQIRKRDHADGRQARERIAELLALPAHLEVEAIISVGYPAEEKAPHPKESLPFEKISYNQYGNRTQPF